MPVLVDTSVWSLALRRKHPNETILTELKNLSQNSEALAIGTVIQEFLSSTHNEDLFFRLLHNIRAISSFAPTEQQDYELAAEYHNICRSKGIQGSPPDFLLCSTSTRLRAPIFTTDQDFTLYAQYLPITLYHP